MKYIYIFILLIVNMLAIANPNPLKGAGENIPTQTGNQQPGEVEQVSAEPEITIEVPRLRLPQNPTIGTEGNSRLSNPDTLEKTALGRAVIEGNIEAYVAALKDLSNGFHIDLSDILTAKTSTGKTLPELMVEVKSESAKEYFSREIIHFLAIVTKSITDKQPATPKSNPNLVFYPPRISTHPINVPRLLALAESTENHIAYRLLEDFQSFLTLPEEYSRTQQDTIQALLKRSKSESFTSAGIFTGVAGILSIMGYMLLSGADDANTLVNLLSSKIPKIPLPITIQPNLNDATVAGILASAVGVAMAAKAFGKCREAFIKAKQARKMQ